MTVMLLTDGERYFFSPRAPILAEALSIRIPADALLLCDGVRHIPDERGNVPLSAAEHAPGEHALAVWRASRIYPCEGYRVENGRLTPAGWDIAATVCTLVERADAAFRENAALREELAALRKKCAGGNMLFPSSDIR